MRHRQRGQLVLIAAILVATAILGAVVLLNAVHSSPEVKAQTDAQSLSNAERTVNGIQQDLRRVFFATNATDGEQYPFARESDLDNNTGSYAAELGSLVSRDGAAVVSVEYNSTNSKTGGFVAGEVRNSEETVIEDADSVPYLSVNASSVAQPIEITIERAGESNKRIELNGSSTTYGNVSGPAATCSRPSGDLRLELTRGTGTLRGENGGVCELSVYDDTPTEYTISIEADNRDGSSFAVSATGSNVTRDPVGFETVRSPVVVNPAFDVSYHDPSVTYQSTLALFRGDDR